MTSGPSPRVAVLAVHGVADQAPYSTQCAAARLLLGSRFSRDYSEFIEEDIVIGLEDVQLGDTLDLESGATITGAFAQASTVSRAISKTPTVLRYRSGKRVDCVDMSEHAIEHESMREQLQGVAPDPSETILRTKVLKGRCDSDASSEKGCGVDIYEMHWADLSRLKNGYFSAFFEFYLLLFFFARIGGLALERALPVLGRKSAWKSVLRSHHVVEFALVIGVPVTHLCILSLAVSGAPYFIEDWVVRERWGHGIHSRLLFGAGLVFAAVGAGVLIGRWFGLRHWWLAFIVCAGLSFVFLMLHGTHPPDMKAIVFTIWVLLSSGLLWISWLYAKRRPGAFYFSALMFAITGALLFAALFSDQAAQAMAQFAGMLVNSGQRIMVPIPAVTGLTDVNREIFNRGVVATLLVVNLNIAAWLIFVFGALANSILGLFALQNTPPHLREQAGQVLWTGALSLVLSGLLIMMLTFSLWEIAVWFSSKMIPVEPVAVLRAMVDLNIFPHLPIGAVIVALVVGFALWVIAPAPFSEWLPPRDDQQSVDTLGDLLSDAYKKMRWSGEALRMILIVGIPTEWLYLVMSRPPITDFHRTLIFLLGIATLTFLFGTKGPFQVLSMGFRAGLDIGLDVTNWLRIFPREKNVRAAICRRYVSLLRHIAGWRDRHTGRGYDALVIVAHSQGTVITADLLRFLKRERELSEPGARDQRLEPYYAANGAGIPIYLLTFGSPLRQLYSRRFPFQYHWCGPDTGDRHGRTLHGPDPQTLGVAHWSNLYCSGDYVGRHLWYAESDPDKWRPQWHTQSDFSAHYANTREMCAGYGGHTRYWTGRIKPVAEELHRLIVRAAG